MPFTLPDLPYKFDALESVIDAKTMEIHHDKHHAAYIAKLNDAIAKHPELPLEQFSQAPSRPPVRNFKYSYNRNRSHNPHHNTQRHERNKFRL